MIDWSDFRVFVNRQLYEKAKAGDQSSIDELKRVLNGVTIYDHIYSGAKPTDEAVTIEDLVNIGIVEAVTLDCAFFTTTRKRLNL